jgi:hypothetical protein
MNQPVRKNEDLHGNAPDSCPVVLLLVDVLNDVDFPGKFAAAEIDFARSAKI